MSLILEQISSKMEENGAFLEMLHQIDFCKYLLSNRLINLFLQA
jgi:hypothetical protein